MPKKYPANLFIRFLADQIDFWLLLLPHTFYLTLLAQSQSIPQLISGLFFYLIVFFFPLLLLGVFYKPLMTHYFGGSFGKLLSGLIVTNLEYKPLSLKRALFRYTVGYAFSSILFGLGFFSILKDENRMGWHDKAVGSRVLQRNNIWPLALVILILLMIANTIFLLSTINTISIGPLPSQFMQLNNSLQEPQKKQPDEKLQQSFLYLEYPSNTHIGLTQENN